MDEKEYQDYQNMVRSFQAKDDPTGWFDAIYSQANGDHTAVFWADLAANPELTEWMKTNPIKESQQAIAIGCGVGDDAEAMSAQGYQVTAFDIAPSAIELCLKRYPSSSVHYLVADLFQLPQPWLQTYDLVYECNTIQVLPGKYRTTALEAMVSLIKPGGNILVSCRSRLTGEQENAIPLPLDQNEMDAFKRSGLEETLFKAYNDEQEPPVPHFFACYQKPRT